MQKPSLFLLASSSDLSRVGARVNARMCPPSRAAQGSKRHHVCLETSVCFTPGISTFIYVKIISSEPLTRRGSVPAGQRLPAGSSSPPEPHINVAWLAETHHASVPFWGGFWQAAHVALPPCETRTWPLIPVHPRCCPPAQGSAAAQSRVTPKYGPCSHFDLIKAVNTADLLDAQKNHLLGEIDTTRKNQSGIWGVETRCCAPSASV